MPPPHDEHDPQEPHGPLGPLESLLPPDDERSTPLEFHGRGDEYFRIWIVNKALSLLTLGIYSAWAKVRTRRYFYGNTGIEDSRFEYLADPLAILKGRLLAAGALIIALVTMQFMPLLSIGMFVLIAIAIPWIIVKAKRFNARVTAFRNVRFDFVGTYQRSYEIFFWYLFLIPLTLGLITPYIRARAVSFLFSGHRYGDQQFDDEMENWDVYMIYLASIGIQMLFGVLLVAFIAVLMFMGFDLSSLESEETFTWWFLPIYGFAFLAGLFVETFISVRIRNLLFNHSVIGSHARLQSRAETWPLFGIYLQYGLLTLVTLGLAYPWLEIAKARYLADCTTVYLKGSLDDIVETAAPAGSAAAEQLGEALDLDLGFGF